MNALGDRLRLPMRLVPEARRAHVRYPNLDGTQPLGTQSVAMLAHLHPSRLGTGGYRHIRCLCLWLHVTYHDPLAMTTHFRSVLGTRPHSVLCPTAASHRPPDRSRSHGHRAGRISVVATWENTRVGAIAQYPGLFVLIFTCDEAPFTPTALRPRTPKPHALESRSACCRRWPAARPRLPIRLLPASLHCHGD